MNDEELERRLREEIQRRVSPPDRAPVALRRQVEMLGLMEPVRGPRVSARLGWRAGLLVAAAAVAALVAVSVPWQKPAPEDVEVAVTAPAGVAMFGRIDPATAWAADAESVYVTGDGGASWSSAALPKSGGEPGWGRGYPVFADTRHGWVVSWSTRAGATTLVVNATADGGRTWRPVALDGTFDPSPVIGAIDRDHAWLYAARRPGLGLTLFTTADGGASWRQADVLPPTMVVQFVSPAEAWGFDDGMSRAVTNVGLRFVSHSLDGGATWSSRSLPVPAECRTLLHVDVPADGGNGWLRFQAACFTSSPLIGLRDPAPVTSGDVQIQAGSVLLTFGSYDGGNTWLLVSSNDLYRFGSFQGDLIDPPFSRWQILLQNPVHVVSVLNENGGGVPFLSASFDEGRTWIGYPLSGRPGRPVLGEWVSPDDVWVAVDPQDGGGLRIYATDDRGGTWRQLLNEPPDQP